MPNPSNNEPSRNGHANARGMVGSFVIPAATAVVVVLVGQALTAPKDVSALQSDMEAIQKAHGADRDALLAADIEARIDRNRIRASQSNVRERLKEIEERIKDRYTGEVARTVNKHFTFRLDGQLERLKRLESSCLGHQELQQPTQQPTPRPRKRT